MDYQLIIAIGALAISALVALTRAMDKSLSIREHEEFRVNIKDRIAEVVVGYRRETDRLEDRIKTLEQTRPTTGEIEARLDK
jgi:hypothetical protein